MVSHCLDCDRPCITSVCGPCTEARKERDGDRWFDQLWIDLWAHRPQGNWDGLGDGKQRSEDRTGFAAPKRTTRKRTESTQGEPAW